LAAQGLVNQSDLTALIDGTRRPDLADPRDHIKAGEERRHFLRSRNDNDLNAWYLAINYLRNLHQSLIATGNRNDQLRLAGEALHLIQDSFAPAHVERDPGNGDILKVRLYGSKDPNGNHLLLIDPRDDPFSTGLPPMLTPEAKRAVTSSKEYLKMTLFHLLLAGFTFLGDKAVPDLNRFISKWLWLRRPELSLGSQGQWVQELAGYLNAARASLRLNVPMLPNDGDFNGDVRYFVSEFQKASDLAPTGIVEAETWKKLVLP
jgi:hypothetical protein